MRVNGIPSSYIEGIKRQKLAQTTGNVSLDISGDQTTVSDKAQFYKALVSKAKEIPDISDEGKVKKISDSINNGTYTINSSAIARKLLGL